MQKCGKNEMTKELAIRILSGEVLGTNEQTNEAVKIAVDALTQTERKKGKWKVTSAYIKCSECGESFMLIPQNYCPNCGARMEVTK